MGADLSDRLPEVGAPGKRYRGGRKRRSVCGAHVSRGRCAALLARPRPEAVARFREHRDRVLGIWSTLRRTVATVIRDGGLKCAPFSNSLVRLGLRVTEMFT